MKTSDPNTLGKKDPYGGVTVKNMMQSEAKAQFEGICVQYPTPDTTNKLYRIHGQVDMSLNKAPKSTFLSQIITDAKSVKGKRPGPGDYNREKAQDYATQHNTKRYQWNKEKKTSFTDVIQKREKVMKGPADYTDPRKQKIPGNYTLKTVTGQLMNETEFMAKQSPGSNHYNANLNASSSVSRITQANMNRDRSAKSTMVKIKRDDSPSPTSYKDVDTKWKMTSTYRNTSSHNYTIKKDKKGSFIEESLKSKKTIPQVGHYQDTMDQFLKLSRGTNIPHYKRGR